MFLNLMDLRDNFAEFLLPKSDLFTSSFGLVEFSSTGHDISKINCFPFESTLIGDNLQDPLSINVPFGSYSNHCFTLF